MDFQIYDCSDSQTILMSDVKKPWNMENDEYFNWTNNLKIDEEQNKNPRKRKFYDSSSELVPIKNPNYTKPFKEQNENKDCKKSNDNGNGTSRMPQWQVDDIADLNADIEGSLNGLGADHSNNSFNMSEAILSLSGMTVFKQEAPSPTNDSNVNQYHQNEAIPVTTSSEIAISQSNPITTDSHSNSMLNTTLHQLLSQTGYNNIENTIDDGQLLNTSPNLSQDGYGISSSSNGFTEDCRFQYVLAAATSIATKINEDTLTYLNQGQSYEIKLKKLGDLSMYRGKLLKSIIRICFHERRLQYMEKEQMNSWQQSRPGDRILEIDVPLSYGLYDVIQPNSALNTVQFSWDPTKEVGAYIKVNCISTEFTPKKHGGEKGVPFRIQVETYQANDGFDSLKRLHAAACQIKVFKLKGADRKHKQDREKILKRPISEQEKYQPSYDCTVLNDIPNDTLISPLISAPYSPDSNSPNNFQTTNDDKNLVPLSSPTNSLPPNEKTQIEEQVYHEAIMPTSNPQQTINWLTANRFEKYLQTFINFSGSDMLRMTRADLMQICGHADGIRLYNALHLKVIAPKLTIYVGRENATLFNAIFLSTLTSSELLQKLSTFMDICRDNIKDIYIQGPQGIHVQLTNDFLKHIKDETMFHIEIVPDNGNYILLLKTFVK